MSLHLRSIIFLACLLSLAACQTTPPRARPLASIQQSQPLCRTELYFAAVPPAEWNAFLAREVTPRFPDGLSWFDVHGQWLGKDQTVHKLPSRVLIIIHDSSPAKDRAVEEIRTAFKKKYHQTSVLRVSFSAATSF